MLNIAMLSVVILNVMTPQCHFCRAKNNHQICEIITSWVDYLFHIYG
jgi:hypothetical protein